MMNEAGQESSTELLKVDDSPPQAVKKVTAGDALSQPVRLFSDEELEKAARDMGMAPVKGPKIRGSTRFGSIIQDLGVLKTGIGLYVGSHDKRSNLLKRAERILGDKTLDSSTKVKLIETMAGILNDQDDAVDRMIKAKEQFAIPESTGESDVRKGPQKGVAIQVNVENKFPDRESQGKVPT